MVFQEVEDIWTPRTRDRPAKTFIYKFSSHRRYNRVTNKQFNRLIRDIDQCEFYDFIDSMGFECPRWRVGSRWFIEYHSHLEQRVQLLLKRRDGERGWTDKYLSVKQDKRLKSAMSQLIKTANFIRM